MTKKMSLIILVTFIMFLPSYTVKGADGEITNAQYSIKIHNQYNAFGIAVSSTQISTQTITTEDKDGNKTTSVTTTITKSSYHNGALKTDTITSDSITTDSKGNITSISHYEDTYHYDKNGFLESVSGKGTSENYTYGYTILKNKLKQALNLTDAQVDQLWNTLVDQGYISKDGVIQAAFDSLKSADEMNLGGLDANIFKREAIYNAIKSNKTYGLTRVQIGKINRIFEVRDGQAVLVKVETTGKIYDGNIKMENKRAVLQEDNEGDKVIPLTPDGKPAKEIGTFSNTTTIDYAYLGGNWVSTKQTIHSHTNVKNQYEEDITKIITYTRDQNTGAITNMSQTVDYDSAKRIQYTSNNSKVIYNLKPGSYNATISYHSQQGFYVSDETYEWIAQVNDPSSNTPQDPWTMGKLAIVRGHLALLVNPKDVKGRSFYQMDPTVVTGVTPKDENGNYIIMVAVEDEKTKEELMALVGHKVNLMWQYYTKSSVSDSSGYGWIWLAPTSDGRVRYHLNHDNESKVEQFGGDWDRTKQYVVID